MAQKLYDLTVIASSYTNMAGQKKNHYVNVGSVWQDDRGGQYISIQAHVNFSAFPRKDGSESVIVSMFEPKDKQQNQQNHNFNGVNNSNNFNTSAREFDVFGHGNNSSNEEVPF